jgi:hypothetical protein
MTVNQHIAAARVSSQHVSSRAEQMDDGEPSDLALPDEFLAPPTPFRTRASLSTAPMAANMSSSRSTAPLAANVSSSRNTAPLAADVSSNRSTAPLAADLSSSRNTTAPLAANVSSSRNTAPLAANMSSSRNVSSRRSGATSTDFSRSQRYLRYQFTSFLQTKMFHG